MNIYDDIVGNKVMMKTLEYRGHQKSVFFRQLTAAERVNISRGQKISLESGDRAGVREVDAGETIQRTHKFLFYCNVTEDGKQAFKTEREVGELPEDLVTALNRLANEAIEEDSEQQDLGKS